MDQPVLLLDCGGTLSWPPFDRLDKILSDLKGRTIGEEAHYRAYYLGNHALDEYLREHRGAYPVSDSLSLNHWVYEQGIAREGFAGLWTRDCTMELLRRDGRLGKWDYTFPWIKEALERLKAAGLRMGLVSNADGHVRELLAGHGYAGYFETIVDSYIEQIWKPDPRLFYAALDRMGLGSMVKQALDAAGGKAERPPVLYVGDSFRADHEGAHAAGL
ncbi:HAD family hydrolase, partial [bacterium]|nr:HAD family hydrolase [bacterium]